jgi:hypothetical protein
LLVSIQKKNQRMALSHKQREFITFKAPICTKIKPSSNSDPVLCNHCKRTASNGVRCLGMCVADSDY